MVLTYTVSIISKPAITSVPISAVLANRFSPRILDNSHEVTREQVLALAEAARWAPSSNNSQPWRLGFFKRGSAEFKAICEKGLTGFNQTWAPNSSLLVVVMKETHRPDGTEFEPNGLHYNLGLASSQIVFEAETLGLRAHYMTGINASEIDQILGVDGAKTFSLISIGVQADLAKGSAEAQEREQLPRERKPLAQILINEI